MSSWVQALKTADLKPGTMVNVKLNGQNILIAQVNEQYFALLNDCPHLGCLLHRGKLQDYELTCPCHDWIFDIRTGEFVTAPEITIPTYPVRIEAGQIFVNLGGI
ncbi:MAG: Rieske (2Fe-2S) protein [Firmicutes bacterium]|nr:Rieske (2Fe-2S) protein [Bacillota bacterium]